MGLFNFIKKKKETSDSMNQFEKTNDLATMGKILAENGVISVPKDKHHNTLGESLDHLTSDGELPFGWIYHNKEFTERIEKEFSYFLNCWISVRGKDASKEYAALKSLVSYIKDAEKLCKSKGVCFCKWFSDCVADQQYLQKREMELKQIQDSLQA